MTPTKTDRKPSDLLHPGLAVSECVTDLDEAVWGEIREASKVKRATAISSYCAETGLAFNDVSCTVRYLRLFDRQDGWDAYGSDRWFDDWEEREGVYVRWNEEHKGTDDEWTYHVEDTGERVIPPEIPSEPPADWEPRDEDPAWEFCSRSAPGAVKVWFCQEKPRS